MNHPPSSSSALREFGNTSPPRCIVMDSADLEEMKMDCQLPEFNKKDPLRWFRQAESIFNEKKIVQPPSKFYHVVQILPMEMCGPVYTLMYPPGVTGNVYDQLRDRLIVECQRQRAMSAQKMFSRHIKRKHGKIHPVVPYGKSVTAKTVHSKENLRPNNSQPRIIDGKINRFMKCPTVKFGN